MILIIGTPEDAPSVRMHDKLTARGEKVYYLDTTRFPHDWKISFDPIRLSDGTIQFPPDIREPLADVKSVYRRWSRGITSPQESDPVLQEAIYWNLESTVGTFFRCFDCLWVNSQDATEMHKYKGYQLKLLKAAGLRIPKTLMTNIPEDVIDFYSEMKGEVIYKPIRGWAHTEKMKLQDLTPERLASLPYSPIQMQEFVPGTDIRVYVVQDELFAMEILADTLDFREDTDAKRVPIELPDHVAKDCLTLARTLNMAFTGIDLRRTPDGEYVFFEGNATPLFIFDEDTSGYPISDRLADLLIRGK